MRLYASGFQKPKNRNPPRIWDGYIRDFMDEKGDIMEKN
jgi:hypothetical protein